MSRADLISEEREALVLWLDTLPKSDFFADLGRAGEGPVFFFVLGMLFQSTSLVDMCQAAPLRFDDFSIVRS